jgi:plastocyanin
VSTKLAISASLAIAALVAAPPAATPSPEDGFKADNGKKRVTVNDNFFEPRLVSIDPDEKVVWVWRGENEHNVTFTKVPRGAGKHGAETRRVGRFRRTFRKRGLYKYQCTIHAGMKGVVDVGYRPPATGSAGGGLP